MSEIIKTEDVIASLRCCAAKRRNCKQCAYADNCKELYNNAALLLTDASVQENMQERVEMLSVLIGELENKLKALEIGNITLKAAADQYKASCIEFEAYNKELFTAFNKMKALYKIKCAELEEVLKKDAE